MRVIKPTDTKLPKISDASVETPKAKGSERPVEPDAFGVNQAPEVVRLAPLDGTPLRSSPTAQAMGWQAVAPDATNAKLTPAQEARVHTVSALAMAQVDQFAARHPNGGTLQVELEIRQGGELGGMMEARNGVLARFPGAEVHVMTPTDFPVAGDAVTFQVKLPALAQVDPKYKHLAEKYRFLTGADRGRYQGKSGGEMFDLPRRVDPGVDGTRLASHHPVLFGELVGVKPGGISFDAFLRSIEATIPAEVLQKIDQVVEDAIRLGDPKQTKPPIAAPFPLDEKDKIRHALCYSWLHSRDMTVIQDAIGYPLQSTGRHDIQEFASTDGIIRLVEQPKRPQAQWFKDYVATLKPGEQVNIGFFNPSMVASIWAWKPQFPDINQEAMDMHRRSDHHDGEDPVEGAVNNIFHQREETFGVRNAHTAQWLDIGHKLEQFETALKLAKSEAGVGVARDVAPIMRQLEVEGKITPWYLIAEKP